MAPPPRDGVPPPSTFAEGRSKRDRLLQSEERQLPVPVAQSQRSSHYRFKRPDSPAPHAHERRSVAYYMLPLLAHERAATRHSQEPDSSAPSTAVNEDPLGKHLRLARFFRPAMLLILQITDMPFLFHMAQILV
jgi:hypothetical protein